MRHLLKQELSKLPYHSSHARLNIQSKYLNRISASIRAEKCLGIASVKQVEECHEWTTELFICYGLWALFPKQLSTHAVRLLQFPATSSLFICSSNFLELFGELWGNERKKNSGMHVFCLQYIAIYSWLFKCALTVCCCSFFKQWI